MTTVRAQRFTTVAARAAAMAGAAVLALAGSPSLALAQDGSLDPTFGKGGKVTTDFSRKVDLAQGVAVQPDGKLVVAGWATVSGAYRFGVARYNADGSLDTSFGTGGKVTTAFGGVEDTASAVAIQTDGKIVVAGTADTDGNLRYAFAVARYNPDGTLDTSFSGDGKATVFVIGTYSAGHALAIQPDGKIVVAGFAGNSFIGCCDDAFFGVVRLEADGDLDPTFGNFDDGKSITDFGDQYSNATSVALQSDGMIVVAGYSGAIGANDFAVVRFDANGYEDATFGTDPGIPGRVVTDIQGGNDFGQSVAVDGAGNVIVSGQAGVPNGLGTFGLVRYTSVGVLDTSFGADGKVATDFFGYGSNALAVKATSGGIVAAGYAQDKRSRALDFALARFNSDGSLDTTFDSDGKVTTSFSSGGDAASAIAIDGAGDIVAAGQAQDKDFAIARYNGN